MPDLRPVVYSITNKKNGKAYIGSATCVIYKDRSYGKNDPLIVRRYNHVGYLRTGKHKNKKLQKDWNLYGEDSFVFEEIKRCNTLKEVREEEQLEIIRRDTSLIYNTTIPDDRIFHLKNKDGRTFRGYRFQFLKQNKSILSSTICDLLNGKIKTFYGWSIIKIEGDFKKNVSPNRTKHDRRAKPIECVCLITGKVERFSSITQAIKQKGINPNGVNICLKNEGRTYKNCVWRYI